MKDLIEISVNGKVVASHEMYLEGASPLQRIERVKRFSVALADTGVIIESEFELLGDNIAREDVFTIEKKGIPIESMVKTPQYFMENQMRDSVVIDAPTPVQKQMGAISTHHEIPIKTRKPRGPNKSKEEVVEKSVFDKEDIVKHVEEIEKKGEFVSLEDAAKELKIVPVVEVKTPTTFTPTTPARINELAKLIKMWCKASALKIETVTIDLLKAQAFDIVENDSDETIIAGIKEAERLMKG